MYPPSVGGAQIHLHCLAAQMQALGHEVQVVTQSTTNRRDWLRLSTVCGEPPANFVHENVPVARLGFSRTQRLRMLPWASTYYMFMKPAVRQLASVIREQLTAEAGTPEIVHCSRIGREFLARAALDMARARNIPFVLTPNHHERWRGPMYREYDRIYRAADAIFALTEVEKDLLVKQKGVRAERVHVTGIGPVLSERFSAEDFRRQYDLRDPFVLFVGQQVKYKGIAAVVEAAHRVWLKHPRTRFVFIGPPTPYSKQIFEGCRDDRLVNLGKVDLETKTSAIAACELLCVPSVQESFGGVFVEAWSHRKAVIGGRIPPVASIVQEGINGYLSDQSPDELAELLCRLLADRLECQALGEAGWLAVQEKYSWRKLAAQTASVYETLCGKEGLHLSESSTNLIASSQNVVAVVP